MDLSDLLGDRGFWSALIGAVVGGLLAILAASFSLRSARKTAIDLFRIQELQLIATELPATFNTWQTSIYSFLRHEDRMPPLALEDRPVFDAENERLSQQESDARRRLLAWTARLGEENQYIREEVDHAIQALLDGDRDGLTMRLTAASIFVNANLPRALHDEVKRRQHPVRYRIACLRGRSESSPT